MDINVYHSYGGSIRLQTNHNMFPSKIVTQSPRIEDRDPSFVILDDWTDPCLV